MSILNKYKSIISIDIDKNLLIFEGNSRKSDVVPSNDKRNLRKG